jgi:hypothetical protein
MREPVIRESDRQAAYKRLTNRLVVLKLLTEAKKGELQTCDLRAALGMNAYHFRLVVVWLLSYGCIKDLGEIIPNIPPQGRAPKNNLWKLTEKGRSYLKQQEGEIVDDLSVGLPNYQRIRKILNLESTVSNTEAIDLWNEYTDFYIPFGDEELRGMMV